MSRRINAAGARGRRKSLKLIVIAIAGIAILGMGAVATISFSARPAQQSSMFGGLGSAHEHAEFIIKINGTVIDFSEQRYQVKSPYIHVEGGVGTTLHKHARLVPVSEFLKSINMSVSDDCFEMDDGKKYCSGEGNHLRFFVNAAEKSPSNISSYVLSENDRFLIIYGNQTEEGIAQELEQLAEIEPFRS